MAGDGLRRQRPAGILTHLALSECLGNLPTALQEVVERQLLGSVIYTGGDDLLALAPAENLAGALDGIARSVARPTDEERRVLLPGGSFTVSAAALIFPHNDSLSGAIREVTSLLKSQAKEKSGRQSGVIACRRQSGQQTMAWGRWGLVPRARFGTLQELVRAIAHEEEISPRFVQHAFQFAHALSGLDDREGLEAMAVHLFGRSAEEGPLAEQLAKRLRWLISDFYYEWHESGRLLELSPWQRTIDWLVTARFLARQAGPPPPAQAAGTTLEEKKP